MHDRLCSQCRAGLFRLLSMITLDLQKCRRCGLIKAAGEFYKNRLMLDGLYSHCKTCYQASAAARSAARNPVDAKACRRCGKCALPRASIQIAASGGWQNSDCDAPRHQGLPTMRQL